MYHDGQLSLMGIRDHKVSIKWHFQTTKNTEDHFQSLPISFPVLKRFSSVLFSPCIVLSSFIPRPPSCPLKTNDWDINLHEERGTPSYNQLRHRYSLLSQLPRILHEFPFHLKFMLSSKCYIQSRP